MEGDAPSVLTNPEGARTTPSVVAFTKAGERLVGQVAKRQAATNPERTLFSIKRFMGRRFEEIGDEARMVPYRIVAAPNGEVRVELDPAEQLSPPEVSAIVLRKMKDAAEQHLGQK